MGRRWFLDNNKFFPSLCYLSEHLLLLLYGIYKLKVVIFNTGPFAIQLLHERKNFDICHDFYYSGIITYWRSKIPTMHLLNMAVPILFQTLVSILNMVGWNSTGPAFPCYCMSARGQAVSTIFLPCREQVDQSANELVILFLKSREPCSTLCCTQTTTSTYTVLHLYHHLVIVTTIL